MDAVVPAAVPRPGVGAVGAAPVRDRARGAATVALRDCDRLRADAEAVSRSHHGVWTHVRYTPRRLADARGNPRPAGTAGRRRRGRRDPADRQPAGLRLRDAGAGRYRPAAGLRPAPP